MTRRQIFHLSVSPETKAALLAVHRTRSVKAKENLQAANLSELISSTGYVARKSSHPSRPAMKEGAQ